MNVPRRGRDRWHERAEAPNEGEQGRLQQNLDAKSRPSFVRSLYDRFYIFHLSTSLGPRPAATATATSFLARLIRVSQTHLGFRRFFLFVPYGPRPIGKSRSNTKNFIHLAHTGHGTGKEFYAGECVCSLPRHSGHGTAQTQTIRDWRTLALTLGL